MAEICSRPPSARTPSHRAPPCSRPLAGRERARTAPAAALACGISSPSHLGRPGAAEPPSVPHTPVPAPPSSCPRSELVVVPAPLQCRACCRCLSTPCMVCGGLESPQVGIRTFLPVFGASTALWSRQTVPGGPRCPSSTAEGVSRCMHAGAAAGHKRRSARRFSHAPSGYGHRRCRRRAGDPLRSPPAAVAVDCARGSTPPGGRCRGHLR